MGDAGKLSGAFFLLLPTNNLHHPTLSSPPPPLPPPPPPPSSPLLLFLFLSLLSLFSPSLLFLSLGTYVGRNISATYRSNLDLSAGSNFIENPESCVIRLITFTVYHLRRPPACHWPREGENVDGLELGEVEVADAKDVGGVEARLDCAEDEVGG